MKTIVTKNSEKNNMECIFHNNSSCHPNLGFSPHIINTLGFYKSDKMISITTKNEKQFGCDCIYARTLNGIRRLLVFKFAPK